jgi:histidinol phosphatase-like PHP family hydrolase
VDKIILPETHPYFYETHLHTSSGSACGICTPLEAVIAHQKAGYTGIVVTEHNWNGNTAVPFYLPWTEWVDKFVSGYEEARTWGLANDFDVFWGYEANYEGTEFLIYGLEPDFLYENPDIKWASIEEQHQLIKEAGGIVVHAHPFREAAWIPELRFYPFYIDAVEGINAAHYNRYSLDSLGRRRDNQIFNLKAIDYAHDYSLPMTAGSDTHSTFLCYGGMAFGERLRDSSDLAKRIVGDGRGYLLTDGVSWYDESGAVVGEVEYEVK